VHGERSSWLRPGRSGAHAPRVRDRTPIAAHCSTDQGETADPSGADVSLACAPASVENLTDPRHPTSRLRWNYRLFEPFSPFRIPHDRALLTIRYMMLGQTFNNRQRATLPLPFSFVS